MPSPPCRPAAASELLRALPSRKRKKLDTAKRREIACLFNISQPPCHGLSPSMVGQPYDQGDTKIGTRSPDAGRERVSVILHDVP
jgi:hypothetical protein